MLRSSATLQKQGQGVKEESYTYWRYFSSSINFLDSEVVNTWACISRCIIALPGTPCNNDSFSTSWYAQPVFPDHSHFQTDIMKVGMAWRIRFNIAKIYLIHTHTHAHTQYNLGYSGHREKCKVKCVHFSLVLLVLVHYSTPLHQHTCSFVQRGLYERISVLQGTPFPLLYQCTSEPGLAAPHPG